MKQVNARILENKRVAQGFYKMRLGSPYLARRMKPGQFLEARCSDGLDPLLRRPFSAHRISKNGIEILYEVIGKATKALSWKKAGEDLDLIGPLGNGFDIKLSTLNSQLSTILIAGGIGVAPLLALAEELVDRPRSIVHSKKKRLYVLIGAKTKCHILCEADFKKLGAEAMISTENGSKGHKGLVTDLLKSLLSTINYELSTIYACGPAAMLKAVARIAQDRRIPCQVSLEEYMACGVGVCLGCPVRIKGPAFVETSAGRQGSRVKGQEYKMVCKDGPVFDAEEIAW